MLITKSFIFLSSILLSIHVEDNLGLAEVWCAVASFPEVCPIVYLPVCVDTPKDCITTPCFQTEEISSGCEACKTEGVQRYTPGKCQYTCDPGNLPRAGSEASDYHVCASYIENCRDAYCRATFGNSRLACKDPHVVSFSFGACSDEKGGDLADKIPWSGDGEEECLFEEEQTWNEGEDISLYDQDIPELDEVWCAAASFPEVCPAVYEPVCVDAPKQCKTTPCFQTEEISNGCEACKTEGVERYTIGKCQYTCDPINLPPAGSGAPNDPVCAIYVEDCNDASCRATFRESRLACKDSNVVSWSFGACPDES